MVLDYSLVSTGPVAKEMSGAPPGLRLPRFGDPMENSASWPLYIV